MHTFVDNIKTHVVLIPVADCFSGSKSTDELDMTNYERVIYHVCMGAIASGADLTFTVQGTSDASAGNAAAASFYYSVSTDQGETLTAKTRAATYNWTCAGGATDQDIFIETNAELLKAAMTTYALKGVRLVITENQAAPTCTAGVIASLYPCRYAGEAAYMPTGKLA